jgi:hypothetical protein
MNTRQEYEERYALMNTKGNGAHEGEQPSELELKIAEARRKNPGAEDPGDSANQFHQ